MSERTARDALYRNCKAISDRGYNADNAFPLVFGAQTNKRKATSASLPQQQNLSLMTFGATARESLAAAPGASVLAFVHSQGHHVEMRFFLLSLIVYRLENRKRQ
jgi:hypothetical protein